MYSLKTSENQEVFDVLGGVKRYYLAGNYMLKVNNRNTRAKVWNMFKVNNKDTKRRHWRRFGVFIVNFEHISHLCSSVSIVNFEQVNTGWVIA